MLRTQELLPYLAESLWEKGPVLFFRSLGLPEEDFWQNPPGAVHQIQNSSFRATAECPSTPSLPRPSCHQPSTIPRDCAVLRTESVQTVEFCLGFCCRPPLRLQTSGEEEEGHHHLTSGPS